MSLEGSLRRPFGDVPKWCTTITVRGGSSVAWAERIAHATAWLKHLPSHSGVQREDPVHLAWACKGQRGPLGCGLPPPPSSRVAFKAHGQGCCMSVFCAVEQGSQLLREAHWWVPLPAHVVLALLRARSCCLGGSQCHAGRASLRALWRLQAPPWLPTALLVRCGPSSSKR